MINVHGIAFNPFLENTYFLWDESGECAIIDPGCSNTYEEETLADFIEINRLKPVILLNTHCHIDHILGNRYVSEHYGIGLHIHISDLPTLNAGELVADRYGIPYRPSPLPQGYLKEGTAVGFGKSELEIVFTPGHSPGSVCFIAREDKFVIGGDVLFHNSIGRTDLPGGDHEQLLQSIRTELYTLPDDFTVYAGHGPETSIGFEKRTNPFIRA